MGIVELAEVRKTYDLGKVKVEAVKGVSFSIDRGDFVSIAGPSGSGKTTILNMIGLIDRPTGGQVLVDGQETAKLPDSKLTRLRHETLGFIFQSFNLIPVLNVFENIEFPLLLGRSRPSKRERAEWINRLIDEVGLEKWRKHKPNELSGGQRQRVAIARALVTKPAIVLADEPTANLDSATGHQILELMKKMNDEFKTTFIFSTHDPKIVDIADHIIRLRDGEITENYKRGDDVGAEG
jgi:putative ABC transport system ATP-binding protein